MYVSLEESSNASTWFNSMYIYIYLYVYHTIREKCFRFSNHDDDDDVNLRNMLSTESSVFVLVTMYMGVLMLRFSSTMADILRLHIALDKIE